MVAQPSPYELRGKLPQQGRIMELRTHLDIAINTVFGGLALVVTTFRLLYRWRLRRCWWDDAWAGVSMAFQLLLLIAVWMRTDVPGIFYLMCQQK
jgi:hypothetical protein